TRDYAALLKSYGLSRLRGDRYGGAWPVEMYASFGVTYTPSPLSKSDLYGELLAPINAGRVELLDLPRLKAQLCGLERRTARGGKASIDHGPGAHDDVCNAVAGAVLGALPGGPMGRRIVAA